MALTLNKAAKLGIKHPSFRRSTPKKCGVEAANPQEFLNSDYLICLAMRETNRVDRIQVRQDNDGDYWIVITAETGSVGISLSSNHQLNPNRIKLEAWAEDQLRRAEQSKEATGSGPGS